MSVLANFDEYANFWTSEPQLKVIEPFKSFYKADRSKSKNQTSKIMWAIAMLLEIEDNHLALYPEEERRLIIVTDYLKEPAFKWTKYKAIIDAYTQKMITPSKRALIAQRLKTEERTRFLSSVKYTLENARELDSLLANTEKFLAILKNLEDKIKLESSMGNKKGGREESLSEKGVI